MTLLLACMLVAGFEFHGAWYLVWLGHLAVCADD